MKALILVGGFGTRLRPLTINKPKPLVPFCNQPMVMHQITALKEVGVDEVVLAVNYQSDIMEREINKWTEKLGIKVTYSLEDVPMGTAGPLKLAEEVLKKDDDPFFVLNSDINCNFCFDKLLDYHKSHGKEGTIMVTKVTDPSKYGVVVTKENVDGKILAFVEKPAEFVGDRINAGIYIFNKSILNRIEPRPTSIERETFPLMAKDDDLFAMELPGYWMDVGQPKDYLIGMRLFLNFAGENKKEILGKREEDVTYREPVLIHKNAKIGKGSVIGPHVSLDDGCVIGEGVRLTGVSILPRTVVGDHAFIKGSLIGWDCSIGKWARVENMCVFGEDVKVNDEILVNGAKILPNKGVKEDVREPTIIL